jgi:high-affinity iron transporter
MNSAVGHKVPSITAAVLLVLSLSPCVGSASALAADEYVTFVSDLERIRAHLALVESHILDRDSAFVHASIIGKLASQIEKPLREHDRVLADDLYLSLIDFPALVRSGIGSDDLALHISETNLLLDKSLIAVVPSDLRNDHRFYSQIVFILLSTADKEYGKGNNDGYGTSFAYVQRAMSVYHDKVSPNLEDSTNAGFEASFSNLIETMHAGADYSAVTSAISVSQREILAIAGTGESEHAKYFTQIRTLLPQVLEQYRSGNLGKADELAIEAYLDNFEYLEPPLAEHNKDLMLAIEEMMRVELRNMIRDGESVEYIENHLQQISSKLDEAESLLGTRTFSVGSLNLANGNGQASSNQMALAEAQLGNEETMPIGSAEDAAKKEVMSQVDTIRLKLISLLDDYRQGNYHSAYENARSAYLDSYEFIEIPLSPIDPNFTLETEIKFAELRQLIQQRAAYEDVQAKVVELRKSLDESERLVTGPGVIAPAIAFSSSFSIMFREGLESALIIGAILTYLEASRNEKFKKHVHYGILLAIVATAVTWVMASFVISISGTNREMIEAIAALSATGVLFYVSFWILSRIETKKWIEFVKAKVWQATTTGSATVFVLLAFFTVYREGFETVLFYQAMFSFAKYMENFVLLGLVLGIGSLLAIYYVIRRIGRKLPLKVLFALTMGVGAYLSIAFVGNGVRELQEAGYLGITPLFGVVPRLDINLAVMTGIHPTLETIVAQIALLSIYVVGILYVLVWKPKKEQAIMQARKSRASMNESV